MWPPISEAQYRLVHDYPGGAKPLAQRVGMNAGTLCNKVHPAMQHKLTVDEAVALQAAAEDYRLLYAEAQALGHACVKLGDFSTTSDIELLDAYAAWHAEIGETAQAIRDGIAAGRLTADLVQKIKREAHEDACRAFAFIARLEGVCDEAA